MNAPLTVHSDPQVRASNPRVSAFVAANAGSGKTSTLVMRVARLLLHGVEPDRVLCVTYTKAAAAEMQRRLFQRLGDWSIADDDALRVDLARIGEGAADLARARKLFAKALETPGGLKIQTVHAFCEKLLRRFPLEAGLSPDFTVLEDVAAAEVSRRARDAVARWALADPEGPIGRAYARLSIELDINAFQGLFDAFESERAAIAAYVERCAANGEDIATDVWRTCGFPDGPRDPEAIETAAIDACEWERWRAAAAALIASGKSSDGELGRKLAALAECAAEGPPFSNCFAVFVTAGGELAKKLGTKSVDPAVREWLLAEQARLDQACHRAKAARMAQDTLSALTLALAYGVEYAEEKAARRALDFTDLVDRTLDLLTNRADAAWVLYKLDGGFDHVLVDEAQDTAPEQWNILRALTEEFFSGVGSRSDRSRELDPTLFGVGDEKQSIFSFQGARPERLAQEADHYAKRAEGGGRPFTKQPLETNYRSTPQVLAFVDAVFAEPDAHAAVSPGVHRQPIRHIARREDHAGSVELWDLVQDAKPEEPDAWDAPLDSAPPESARKRLARRIADEVAAIVSVGGGSADGVFDKDGGAGRAADPGDVLILVRRRDALFEEIIRALKKKRIPVAGADRLRLSEHIAFQDLLSLGRFALYPGEDLSLAQVLRSPLCDLDEDSLFDLCFRRATSLWEALQVRSGERPEWAAANALLSWVREAARALSPFDLYARLLNRLDGGGRSMRQRLLTRFGPEAEDALGEFLAQALATEARGVHELEGFVVAMERADVEVKRELEAPRGEVRVMTVHGAKGLEAPIVILPDTTANPPAQRNCLLRTREGGFLFAPRKSDDNPASAAARQLATERTEAEALRLLYVAMTRARDRLIVCGRLSAREKAPAPGCWYQRIEGAFGRPEIASRTCRIGAGEAARRRFGADPIRLQALQAPDAPCAALPHFALHAAPSDRVASRYASPSNLEGGRRGPSPSPLSRSGGLGRFRRGALIHRLLQLLPDVSPEARADGARRLLALEPGLDDRQRAEMAEAALGVLDNPRFAEVFGPGSRAEAVIAGGAPDLPAGLRISGRVDRMVVTPERVLVVDFKTNRPAPDRIEDADEAYVDQMAIYVAVLRSVFRTPMVEAALVWTDGPKLMPVPENLIVERLAALRAGA